MVYLIEFDRWWAGLRARSAFLGVLRDDDLLDFRGCLWIGTEGSLPRAIDGVMDRHMTPRREILFVGSRPHLLTRTILVGAGLDMEGVGLDDRSALALTFEGPCQMEGGAAEVCKIHRRFARLRVEDHLYRPDAELWAYRAANGTGWTGENARWLVGSAPKMRAEDRPAPVSRGLAGRLGGRRG